jgi:protein-disulfide isomerase
VKPTTRHALAGAFAALTLSTAFPVLALAQSNDSVAADIAELKKGQQEIKSELAEIKKLLTPKPPPPQVEKLEGAVAIGSIPGKGDAKAAVTMIEFSDFQCPFCKRHVDQTVPALLKDYVDSGKVRYVFRDFPLAALHPQAAKAAEAARCAGDQGKYWDMHDKLFALQPEIKDQKYADFAKQIGLDEAKFDECMTSSRYAAAVQNDVDYGTKLGVRGTPTVVVGLSDGDQVKNATIIRGAQPLATFKEELDKLLAPSAKK